MPIRTLLQTPDAATDARLAAGLDGYDGRVQLVTQHGGVTELVSALQRGDLDIAVASLPEAGAEALARLEPVLGARPGLSLILVTGEHGSEFLMNAMRAGVREVVPREAGPGGVAAAFRRQVDRLGVARGPTALGRVIAFMPAKGGSGATFLAANLGYALSALGQRVALIDLNLQFGDIVLFTSDRRASSDIAQVTADIQRLDAPLLESSMLQASPNLWVLPSPESPERAVEVRPEAIERVIALARSRYDFVILDVGRVLEAVSVRALDAADTIYVVLQATLPSLHDAKRLLGMLTGLGYDRGKLRVAVNRLEKGGDIGVAEIQKTLALEVSVEVPNSYGNVVRSINHGVPILKQSPKDPVARTLADWADSLAPRADRHSGWLRSLFGGKG